VAISNWLSDKQLKELLDRYYDGDIHLDKYYDLRGQHIKQAQETLLDPEVFPTLSNTEFVDRMVDIYKNVVRVPMYYKAIVNHHDEVQAAVQYILESDDDPVTKIANLRESDGEHFRKGLGKSFWSLLIMALDPDNNPYWNNKTEMALKSLGMDYWGKGAKAGEKYQAVIKAYQELKKLRPDSDYITLDHFMHYVTVMVGKDILQEWGGERNDKKIKDDSWAEKISKFQRDGLPGERISVRIEAEGEARELLESSLGEFDEETLRRLFELINSDFYGGKKRRNRFSPAFLGGYSNRIVEQLDLFNQWIPRIWNADENELPTVLGEFWEKKAISYAGTILPTVILYLKDADLYNIWTRVMIQGLHRIEGRLFDTIDSDTYFKYNNMVNQIQERYNLQPQEMDVILYRASKTSEYQQDESTPEIAVKEPGPVYFTGFSAETFKFLIDLQKNNNKNWFDQNRDRYKDHLRDPLRDLFVDVGKQISHLDSNLETEVKFGKVMANINKRFPDEEGQYHIHLWGAFYQADKKKQTTAQLYIIVHPNRLVTGVGVGDKARESLATFNQNLEEYPEPFYLHLQPLLQKGYKITTYSSHSAKDYQEINIKSVGDLTQLSELKFINIEKEYKPSDPKLSDPVLGNEIAQTFIDLYPLYLYFISQDLEGDLASFLEEDEIEIPEEGEGYSLEELVSETYSDIDFLNKIQILLEDKRQIVFYGPPGTGKTYIAKKFSRYFTDQTGGDVQIIQFHPSYAYEEFIEGIRPESKDGQLTYPIVDGIFQIFCNRARKFPKQRFVLIIDEINRGSLPKIFGELLYLLEYRKENEAVNLPYSKRRFNIPGNVYLIGTMNTADRSIALVDHALRRRFHFIPFKPDPEILRAWFDNQGEVQLSWVADLLELLNQQLENDQISWHLQIGHSHWMVKDGNLDEEKITLIWDHSIRPTLEEYFYKSAANLDRYTLDYLKQALHQE